MSAQRELAPGDRVYVEMVAEPGLSPRVYRGTLEARTPDGRCLVRERWTRTRRLVFADRVLWAEQ